MILKKKTAAFFRKTLHSRVFFKANRKVPLKNGTKDFLIAFRLRDRPVFM